MLQKGLIGCQAKRSKSLLCTCIRAASSARSAASNSISLKSRALILLAPGFIWHEQFPQRIVPHHHREVRGPDHQIRP